VSLYVGLISGTSVDGVDAALIEIDPVITLLATHDHSIPVTLRERLLQANAHNLLRETLELDVQVGRLFAHATLALLEKAQLPTDGITAIGTHGQTICHYPQGVNPFTYQIGDPNLIAEMTGITTVADFRRRDIAAGGQGAPLAPAFHQAAFASDEGQRAVLNIGGISNVTILGEARGAAPIGFDTGPGNGLLDAWTQRHLSQPIDVDACWASQGNVHKGLLAVLCNDEYLKRPPPKSTGKEYFNLEWLERGLKQIAGEVAPVDVQRTLIELTTSTISDALLANAARCTELLVCGGGARNPLIWQSLAAKLPETTVLSTKSRGVEPDYVEAMTFAWLASQTLNARPGNLPSVTGAAHEVILGAIYPGRQYLGQTQI